MLSHSPTIRFHADPQFIFPVSCTGSISPRATPQLPYLLTMTGVIPSSPQSENPSLPPSNMYEPATATISSPPKFQTSMAPAAHTIPLLSLPLPPSTTLTAAKTQFLSLVQKRVPKTASQSSAEANEFERQKKKQKKTVTCCWCDKLQFPFEGTRSSSQVC